LNRDNFLVNTKLETLLKESLIKACIYSKKLSDQEKVRILRILNEGLAHIPIIALSKVTGKLLFPKLRNIGLSLSKKFSALSQIPEEDREIDTEKLVDLKQRYDEIMQRYEKIKDTGTEEEKRDLINDIKQLTQEIREFSQSGYPQQPEDEYEEIEDEVNREDEEDIERSDVDYDYPASDTGDSDNSPVVATDINKKNISDVTTEIESGSSQLWNSIAFTKCNQFSLGKLWKCRAEAADRAIAFIKSRVGQCNDTVDPSQCRQSLQSLITKWIERKRNYLKRAR